MKRKIKCKKKHSKKYFYLLLLFIFIYMLTSGISFNLKDILFKTSLSNIVNKDIINRLDFNITIPKNILYNSLNGIISSSNLAYYSSMEDDFNYNDVITDYIEDPSNEKITNPIVYIYNTHQLEEYSMEVMNDYSVKPNVMIASYILREKLNDLGINTIVETSNIKKYLNKEKLSYTYSYVASRHFMEENYKKNKSLKYFIDIHRDSVSLNSTLYNKNDKEYAKVLFVVGLDNKNYKYNLELSKELSNRINNKYNGLSKGIYKKSGKYVNGIYNQDFNKNVILVEVGGKDNTIEQVNNTCEVLSIILSEYIKEESL